MLCGGVYASEDLYTVTETLYICAIGRGCQNRLPMPLEYNLSWVQEMVYPFIKNFREDVYGQEIQEEAYI